LLFEPAASTVLNLKVGGEKENTRVLRKKLTSIYLEPIEEFGHKVCIQGAEESEEKLAVIA